MFNEIAMLDDSPTKRFQFIGGEVCLDFCNTMGGKRGGTTREKLHSYQDFLDWCEQAKQVSESKCALLKRKATEDTTKAGSVLARALELREAIFRVFFAIVERGKPSEADIALLNAELA